MIRKHKKYEREKHTTMKTEQNKQVHFQFSENL